MKQVVLTYFIIVQKNLAALRETPWFSGLAMAFSHRQHARVLHYLTQQQ